MSNLLPEGGGLFKNADGDRARREEMRQATFEETAVKRLLAVANVKFHLVTARQEAARITKEHALSFAWFHDAWPRFPVRMGACKLPSMHAIAVSDLFGSGFTKTKFFREYITFLQQENVDDTKDRAGLVFNWPDIGLMVLHNYPVEQQNTADPDARTERGTRIVRPFGNPLVIYVIETAADFMANIGNDWADV